MKKHCNRRKTNSVPYNQKTQWNYAEDASSIIKSTKCYYFSYPPNYKSTETEHPQKYIKVATIGTIGKDHSSYGKALFQYFQKDLGIPAGIPYTETIAETLRIIDTDIKYYVTQQFPQVQQPVESDPEEYENKSNNSITAQAKSMVNKKPRVLFLTTPSYHQTPQSRIVFNSPLETQSETPQTPGNPHPWNQHSWTKSLGEYGLLFGNLTPAASQTEGNLSTWEQPPAQNLTESASFLTEETAILQPIGSSNKRKQPALAPGEHSNTQTPIPLNITSNTLPINQIMAYWDIAKLEKFSAIERDYYTAAQVLNQFIKELWSSILRSIRPCHPTSLQDTITFTHDFESAEQEVNHTQAVNLAINGTSDIDTKITQLNKKLTQKIEKFLAGTTRTYQPPQRRENNNNSRYPQQQNCQQQQQSWRSNPHNCYYCQKSGHIAPSYLNLMEDQGFDKSTSVEGGNIERISQPSKQTKSNIPLATITKNTTLAAIFLFDIDNLNTHSLFSGAAINQDKPITALYTDARVGKIDIKLILDSGSASSIITKQLMDQLGHRVDCAATTWIITADGNTKILIREIDNFLFEINGIQIPTKVLVMEAIQYQALIEND
ncbi:hypothetical protein G9A89_003815 [Geosiphon pyriformis]|nr:hypothetical protein G9A89_003815 [Geosiphon pyriformis]